MDKHEIVAQLTSALTAVNVEDWCIDQQVSHCPTCDVVLKAPSFSAFFAVVDAEESIAEWATRAQQEIAELLHSDTCWDNDLELVVLAQESQVREQRDDVRRVLENRYTCRKFVLGLNGQPLVDLLQRLPFWPPGPVLQGPATLIGTGVCESIEGFDPSLVSDIASQKPGAEAIAANILAGRYELRRETAATKVGQPGQVQSSKSTRLTGLNIANFRGIKELKGTEMFLGADVVVIYGPNGIGKTSIADAFEWAVTGEISRLGHYENELGVSDRIRHVFSENAVARVACSFTDQEEVVREQRVQGTHRSIGGRRVDKDVEIIDHVVGTSAPGGGPSLHIRALRDLFRGSHLLGQSSIRNFLTVTSPEERFNVLTSMIGADEFVRFCRKTGDVTRRIEALARSRDSAMAQDIAQMAELSRQIETAKVELEQLRDLLEGGGSPEEAISTTLAMAVHHGCPLPQDVDMGQKGSPLHQRLEFVRIQLEPLVASRRKEVSRCVDVLTSIKAALPGYQEARGKDDGLQQRLSAAESNVNQAQISVQDSRRSLSKAGERVDQLKVALRAAAERHGNLVWLAPKLGDLDKHRSRTRQAEVRVKHGRAKLEEAHAQLAQTERSLGNERQRLEGLQLSIARLRSEQTIAGGLRDQFASIAPQLSQLGSLTGREGTLEQEFVQLAAGFETARQESRQAQAERANLQNGLDALTREHGERQAALSRLAELVATSTCPLCGHLFETMEELRQEIARQLSDVPGELRSLQDALQRSSQGADKKALTEAAAAAERDRAQKSLDEVRERKAGLTRRMTAFVAEAAAAEIVLPPDDLSRWPHLLEQASLSRDPEALAGDVGAASAKIAGLETGREEQRASATTEAAAIREAEMQLAEAKAAVQETEKEMMARELDPGAIPDPVKLADATRAAAQEADVAREELTSAEAIQRQTETQGREGSESVSRLHEEIKATRHSMDLTRSELARFESLCEQGNVLPTSSDDSIQQSLVASQAQIGQLDVLEAARQDLSKFARLEELNGQLNDLRSRLKTQQDKRASELRDVQHLQSWATRMAELGREAARQQLEVVGAHLNTLAPAINLIYKRLNPHPMFDEIRVDVDDETNALHILATAGQNEIAVSPPGFFSDAQLNVLAISVFLAGALRQRWSGLETIIIDDPIQQLDEMNVCAFLDLLRGLTPAKQFIVFTCSRDFYLLAIDKFSPRNKSKPNSFRAYRLDGASQGGLAVHCDVS